MSNSASSSLYWCRGVDGLDQTSHLQASIVKVAYFPYPHVASMMNLTIMQQQKGVMPYNHATEKACSGGGAKSPLLMLYLSGKAAQYCIEICKSSSSQLKFVWHRHGHRQSIWYMQVPIQLLHTSFYMLVSEHVAESVQPTIAYHVSSKQYVLLQSFLCIQEKDCQHIMRRVWQDLLIDLGGVSCSAHAVGRN